MKRDQKKSGGGGCHAAGPTAVSIGTTVRLRGLDGRHGRLADAWGEPRAVSRSAHRAGGIACLRAVLSGASLERAGGIACLRAEFSVGFQLILANKRKETDFLTK